jgi:hypothetical protein
MAHKDPRSHHYHAFQNNRQDWSIDRWCRGLRIQRQRLEQHPYFGDVATLLMFDAWQSDMTSHDKGIWTHCWQWCYHKQLPLSNYHRRKLVSIVDHIELRQTRHNHIQQRIQKRQQSAQAR